MNIVKFSVGDTLIMKKKHPCSSDSFRAVRVGSDCRIVCLGCRRDLTFERRLLEKMIKRVIPSEGKTE